jgi:hypothetical protein
MKSLNAGMFLTCLMIAALATAGAMMEPKNGRETETSMTTEEKVVQGFAAALCETDALETMIPFIRIHLKYQNARMTKEVSDRLFAPAVLEWQKAAALIDNVLERGRDPGG